MKWNESGFRPPLCTYRPNWARRTSWGWWDDWDDTVLQTQDSKFEPWRSEAEHATSRSQRLPTILTFTRGWGRNIFVSFKPPRPGTEHRTLAWKAAVLTTTLEPPPSFEYKAIPPERTEKYSGLCVTMIASTLKIQRRYQTVFHVVPAIFKQISWKTTKRGSYTTHKQSIVFSVIERGANQMG